MFHGKAKRIVAALVGVAMVASPGSAWAAGIYCSTYHQVASNATGGDWVGGILSYEQMASVTRSDATTTNTVTTAFGGVPGIVTTITSTTTQSGSSVTTQEPIGTYNMNDGTVWEVNCVTGAARQV